MDTKVCSLTKEEIQELIEYHGRNVSDNTSDRMDRLGYLHKRLKAFDEPEAKPVPQNVNAAAMGWGSTNGS